MPGPGRVAIVGVGYSTVARHSGLSLNTLTAQSAIAAMDDAGVTPRDIDGVAVHSFPHQYVSATHTAAMLGIPGCGVVLRFGGWRRLQRGCPARGRRGGVRLVGHVPHPPHRPPAGAAGGAP